MLSAAGLTLGGCSVRWEDSAPEIPLVPIPTREPIPAEDALLWLLTDCRDLAATESDDAALYTEQVAVLRTALYRAGIPIETLDETLQSAPAAAAPDPAAALRRIGDLAQCGGGLFPLVISLLAQRWSSVIAAGSAVPEEALTPATVVLWDLPFLAVPFAELTDAAEYGFEVVAAQSRTDQDDTEQRESADSSLAEIHRLGQQQDRRSGGRTPPSEIGYPLPFVVNSEESAARLATHVATGLINGYAGLLPTMVGTAQRETARDLVAWLGAATVIGTTWTVPATAFPGTAVDAASTAEQTP